MGNRPFSEVRSNQIPKEIVENLERLGFECRGKYGSFYKREKGFTYRISTHKRTKYDKNVVLTLLYETIDDLKKIKLSKFRKMKEKYLKKEMKKKEKLHKKIKREGGTVYG